MPRQFPEDRARRAVARARQIGYPAAAKEAGVTERTLHNWRKHFEAGQRRPVRMQTGSRAVGGPRVAKPTPPATNAEREELRKQLEAQRVRLQSALKREADGGAPSRATTELIRDVARLERELAEFDAELAAEQSIGEVVGSGGKWQCDAGKAIQQGIQRMQELMARETNLKTVAEATGYLIEAMTAREAFGLDEADQPGPDAGEVGSAAAPTGEGAGGAAGEDGGTERPDT